MGYYSELLLLTKIRKDKREEMREELGNPRYYESEELRCFIELIKLTPQGFLKFRRDNNDYLSDYKKTKSRLLPALTAKWYDIVFIVSWLAPYAEKGGRVHMHSFEADGEDYAYEFDGEGKIMELKLLPKDIFKKPKKLEIGKSPRTRISPAKKKKPIKKSHPKS